MKGRRDVPDLLVEQLVLGELSPARAAEVRRMLEETEGGLERLAEIEASNKEILHVHPPRAAAAEISRRLERKPATGPAWRLAWVAAPVTAAIALMLWLAVPGEDKKAPGGLKKPRGYVSTADVKSRAPAVNEDELEITRKKGGPVLLVFRDGAGKADRLENGAEAAEGDLLQLKYEAGGAAHGLILSVDGRGAVTLHFPKSLGDSTALDPKGAQALPRSYELDDAPGFERFFFVTSDKPIDPGAVAASAESLGTDPKAGLALPDEMRYKEFVLLKPPPEKVEP